MEHNTANGPESKTTRMFRPVDQSGGTGGEIYYLRLKLKRKPIVFDVAVFVLHSVHYYLVFCMTEE